MVDFYYYSYYTYIIMNESTYQKLQLFFRILCVLAIFQAGVISFLALLALAFNDIGSSWLPLAATSAILFAIGVPLMIGRVLTQDKIMLHPLQKSLASSLASSVVLFSFISLLLTPFQPAIESFIIPVTLGIGSFGLVWLFLILQHDDRQQRPKLTRSKLSLPDVAGGAPSNSINDNVTPHAYLQPSRKASPAKQRYAPWLAGASVCISLTPLFSLSSPYRITILPENIANGITSLLGLGFLVCLICSLCLLLAHRSR